MVGLRERLDDGWQWSVNVTNGEWKLSGDWKLVEITELVAS